MGKMTEEIAVRPYRDADRDAVRMIAYRTGFMGDPTDWYWRDFTSFADIWTSYYTDCEPESAFVAERDGSVVGYLLGCVESARAPGPAAALARHTIRRLFVLDPRRNGEEPDHPRGRCFSAEPAAACAHHEDPGDLPFHGHAHDTRPARPDHAARSA